MQDFDAEIKGLEERLASTMDSLNASRQRGASAAVAWLRQHGEELAQSAVIGNPDQAKALGSDGVHDLRMDIRALLQNADAEAAVVFRRVWDHNPGTKTSPPNRRSYLAAAERLVGRIGDLLLARGIIERPPGAVRSGWSTGNISGVGSSSTTDILYRFDPVPQSIDSAIEAYLALLRSVGEQQERLDRVRKTKAQAEAAALWDAAE
jgi:hypothetical protein